MLVEPELDEIQSVLLLLQNSILVITLLLDYRMCVQDNMQIRRFQHLYLLFLVSGLCRG